MKISGIYKITNLINNKVYIGQSNDIKTRWSHERGGSSLHNKELKEDIKKYGLENFSYEILKEEDDKALKNKLEKEYIKFYKSTNPEFGYNKTIGGDGVTKYSEEQKKKHSKLMKEYYKNHPLNEEQKIRSRNLYKFVDKSKLRENAKKAQESNRGRKHSDEAKKKMSDAHKGKYYLTKEQTERHIKMMSIAKYKKVECIETGEVFESMKAAKEKYGKDYKTNHICSCCIGKRKTAFGFHWRYA